MDGARGDPGRHVEEFLFYLASKVFCLKGLRFLLLKGQKKEVKEEKKKMSNRSDDVCDDSSMHCCKRCSDDVPTGNVNRVDV
jgi:hypothetical protein